MNFIPLHVHTSYSLLNSGLRIEDYFSYLSSNKISVAGISDMNNLFITPKFVSLAKKANIKPLIGIQISYLNVDLLLYVKNEKGYTDLVRLIYLNDSKTLKEDAFAQLSKDLVVIIVTNDDNLKNKNKQDLVLLFKSIAMITSSLFIGINATSGSEFNVILREIADQYNYDLVALPLIKYIKQSDELVVRLLDSVKNDQTMDSVKEINGHNYFPTVNELETNYTTTELNNSLKISNLIAFEFDHVRGQLLHFDVDDEKSHLFNLCQDALMKYKLNDKPEYVKRLEDELAVIDKMGYNSYFLIVADYVSYAKKEKILVGPGRGSAAGSLVSYLLNITTIDPLEYDLLFERFLNIQRQTMPDIDIDFMDIYRDKVINYLKEKYGKQRVANIITFQTNGARASLRDIGRIYEIDNAHITLLTKSLGTSQLSLRDSYRNIKAFKTLVDSDKFYLEIVALASKIEGFPRQSGMHAAGVILNNTPLIDCLPVLENDGNLLSQFEMGYLEDQGFLKMDILGLTNLTTIDVCLKLINKYQNIKLDYESLPFDQQGVYDLIASGKTMGIFQLESAGMLRAVAQIKPSNFNDIVAVLALFRPGPMEYIPTYSNRKFGKEKVTYINDDIKAILEPTYGIIVYQEQIMQIARVMAGFDFAKADIFRRAISKKNDTLLQKMKSEFINGCLNNKYRRDEAEHTFNDILKFANYGFNKSHSVSYAKIACQMAYLKLNYPREFYASILNSSISSESKFPEIVSEINDAKLSLLLPCVNKSSNIFLPTKEGLLMPLKAIKGISTLTENKIFSARNNTFFSSYNDFFIRATNAGIGKQDIRTLIEAGALDEFGSTRATMLSQVDNIELLIEVSIFTNDSKGLDVKEIPDDPSHKIIREIELLGLPISTNPITLYTNKATEMGYFPISDKLFGEVKVFGAIKNIKQIRTKKNDQMAFIKLWDYNREIVVTLFPTVFSQSFNLLKVNKVVGVSGRVEIREGKKQILATMLESIEE